MRRRVIIATVLAHVLAWVGLIWLAWPAGFAGIDGANAVGLLTLPVLLSAAGLAATREVGPHGVRTTWPLIGVAVLLLYNAAFFYIYTGAPYVMDAPLWHPGAVLAVLAAAGIFAARRLGEGAANATLWTATAGMLVFCAMTILSIGAIYLPSALALLYAAVVASSEPGADRARA